MIYSLAIIAVIIIGVFTITESFGDEKEECYFSTYIEKSWLVFGERPWVTGSVINCDPENGFEYYSSNEESYYKKDRVFVRVLDINGELVGDGSYKKKDLSRYNDVKLSAYSMSYLVDRSDRSYYKNIENNKVNINPNQYFFYLPQISSLDFEHRGIYQIEFTYGDHVRTIWFATFDPAKWWQDE